MQVSFDPAKNERNIADRDLPFTLAEQLDWATALIEEDTRKAYGGRLHAAVFTPRAGKAHVISLRKANTREVKRHEKTTQP